MAGYGYLHRTSAAYTSPQTDDWTKPSYAADHVHRPVIVDAEGRRRPMIAYSPNRDSEYYVTRTNSINTSPTYYNEPSGPAPIYAHVNPVYMDTFESPKRATNGGWGRPASAKPMSDIPEAIGVLKEVAKPFIPPKYVETMDSVEAAAMRYGNFRKLNFSRKPYGGENNYTTI